MIHKFFNKIPAKTLQYIAEDFRKAGTIAGVGLIGFVLAKDNIDEIEAFVLLTVGITFWLLGLLLNYVADIMSKKAHKPVKRTKQHR
ncbi:MULTISPECIES: hypothetical protein [unclassified Avibacterium]|uniref:hypothetical protein n=1 Tax=unclassified Avibacterium TaxID=2685287 RepID=UPI002026B79B|nr:MULTISPECIES: hypothetical protein [unclassified Avibacterium]MCW9716862.1 hypothetical protein [Avibacterium sp. 21-599]MCW9734195.1 hypothetical protein [Avibacterium sp. 20-15]URL03618.1 hypothetical protein L4F93_08595 [Avibacterium sp. 20-132]URL03830.1 hypothetical protein L4F93_09750 [Avibacterium sp. 20-132]